MLVDLYML